MSGWQQIETAPQDGSIVDLWGKTRGCMIPYKYRIPNCSYRFLREESGLLIRKDWLTERDTPVDATHWMPLPSPPE